MDEILQCQKRFESSCLVLIISILIPKFQKKPGKRLLKVQCDQKTNAAPIRCCIAQAIAPPSIAVCKGHPTPSILVENFGFWGTLSGHCLGLHLADHFGWFFFERTKQQPSCLLQRTRLPSLAVGRLVSVFFLGGHVTESDVPWSLNLRRDSDSEEEDCSFGSGLWNRVFPVIPFRNRWNGLLCQEEVVAQKEPEVEQTYEAAPAVEFEAETMGWWSWRVQPFWILAIQ